MAVLSPAWSQAAHAGANSSGSARPARGLDLFRSHCAGCHGLDGRGGEHGPDIVGDPKLRAMSPAELARTIANGVPRAGMPSFKLLLKPDETRAVVAYLRGASGGGAPAKLPGDAKLGEALFFGKAGCGECHAVRGQGGFLGADLSDYGRGHSSAEIREAIVNPDGVNSGHAGDRESPGRDTVTVTTRAGERWTGIARSEDNFSIQVLDAQGRFHLLMKSDLTGIERQPHSLMPRDYESRLSHAELKALVAYLASRM